ncbi:MAG: prenyltransferase [Bacteroides sp.]|nr:prenyltransferase [Bacteroides sp.]
MDSTHEMVLRTATPETLLMGAASVIMGWAAATVHGNGEALPAILCIFFAVFMQLYNNWSHRYFDIKYKFGEYIDDGYDLSEKHVLGTYSLMYEIAKGALVLAAMVGLALMSIAGWWTLILGLFVYLIAWVNSHGQNPLLRTRLNVFITFLVFGPVGVIGTDLVQAATGHTGTDFLTSFRNYVTWYDLGPAVILSLPAGLIAFASHLAHGLRHFQSDTDNSKRTFQTLIGRRNTAILFLICALLIPFCYVLFCLVITPAPPMLWMMLAPVLVTAFMIKCYFNILNNQYIGTRIIEIDMSWAFLFLALSTYILCLTTGAPNDSPLQYYSLL